MKKHLLKFLLTTCLSLLISIGMVNAQNLLLNGDVESWDNSTTPTSWTKVENITQEVTIVNSVNTGSVNSAKHVGGTKDFGQTITVSPNTEYKITIWYYVEAGDGSDARIWSFFKDAGDVRLADIPALLGPDNGYFTSAASWQKYETTVTSPADAASLYFEVRTYSGATVYWDDLSVSLAADTDAPVSIWNPLTGTTGVEPNSSITITFDEAIRDIGTDADFDNTTIDALITTFETVIESTPVTFDATIDGTNQIITITPDADLAFNTEYTITLAAVEDALDNATSEETITFTTKPDTDKNSIVVAPGTQVSAANIESIVTDSIPVFAFTVSDLGTADGIETKVTQLILKAGPNNTIAFNENLRDGYLLDATDTEIPFAAEPVVTADDITITFNVGDFNVADGTDATYTVYLQIDTANTIDGSVIQMMIDADAHGLTADATGSEFVADFTTDIVGNDITLNVTATELQFDPQPANAYVGDNLAEVKVAVTDINGNIDIDYTTDITITATGATLTGSPVASTPVNGLAKFETLSFSDAGAGVTLTAASGAFTDATSETFNIIEVPANDLFFSEYIEGGSFNKALEIYNKTGTEVDLHDYVIRINSGGADWSSIYEFPEGTMLPNEEVYVIAHAEAIPEILALADSAVVSPYSGGTSHVVNFNGDDGRALCKVEGTDTTIIDIIGNTAGDPGSAWNVAGVSGATKDHTLLRKVGLTHGNTDWTWSAGTNADDSEWKVFDKDVYANLGQPTPEASSETEMLSFTFGNKYDLEEAIITTATSTVDITVINGTDPSALTPTFTISEYATVDSLSGTEQNFSVPYVYTITAEDGVTTEEWTVNVTVSPTLSTFAEILEMEIDGATNVVINSTEGTITADVPYAYDLTSVKPAFEISAGASIDNSQAQNFTNPVNYTVTAQDASTKDWEITLNVFEPTEVTIYDIQYTADASGDSPYENNIIKTSGIVTAINGETLWIQDGAGAWNGVYVFSTATASAVKVGDNIEFAAEVDEFYGLTELKDLLGLNILSSGNALPAITEITTLQAQDEQYEGVLIKVSNAECTNPDADFGMWEINDGTGALLADDDIFEFIPTANRSYNITGLGHYSFDERKILPRSANDIEEVTANAIDNLTLNSVKLYPNPSNGLVTLELNNANNEQLYVEVYDVIGKMVYKTQITENVTNIDLTQMNAGIYYVSVNSNNNKKVSKIMIQ